MLAVVSQSTRDISDFLATVCETVRPMLSDSVCLYCNVGVLWRNGWMDQDETWHGGRPRPRPHCVRWDPAPPPKKGHFSAHVYCGQTAGWIKMPLGTEVDLGVRHLFIMAALCNRAGHYGNLYFTIQR